MANKVYSSTIKFTGQFDTSQITKGLQDIKKQVTNANISDELKKQFEAAFNKLQVNIPALEKLTSKEEFNLKDIQSLQKLLKEVTKDWENLNKVTDQIDLSKTFSAKDLEKINDLDKQIKQTQDNIQKARKELVEAFTNETKISVANKNVSDALTELFTVNPTEIDSKFQEIQDQFAQGVQQTQTELQNKLENANIQKTGKSIIDYFFGENSGVEFANKVGPVKEQINEIIRAYREAQQKGDIAGVAKQVEELNKVLTNTANFKFPEGYKLFGLPTQEDLNTLNQIGGVLERVRELAEDKEVFFTEEEAKLAEQMAQKLQAETDAAKNANQENERLKNTIKDTGDTFKDTGNKVDVLTDTFNRMKAQSEALEATFGGLARRITSSISALTVFNKSIQVVHKAIDSVKELDAAFTQIAIVSERTNEEAWQMFDSFNKLAKQYSITTKDLTEGAKLFYQQGLNAADTMKMVEASTISAALGEVTMTEAANTLTAAIQGYNESAAVAMDYTDKIAMVGAVSAADFNELSAAMEKTASSAYTAGIDFDHLLGYLGKMIEVTREAPANLGTAMKTIIARFEDMKKDPLAILEDGVSANKVETALATIGIALRDTAGEFRPLQDVFTDLGMKWDSLTRNQQAYIATVAAGSRQQSRFLAMFNNFDRTLELVTESQNSAGAALEQYSTYQDSAAAATARLTAAWEEFYSKVVNSSMITTAINSLTKLVEIMSKIGPVWSAALATIAAHGINKVISGNILGKLFSKVVQNGEKEMTVTIGSALFSGITEGWKRAKGEVLEKGIQDVLSTGAEQGIKTGVLKGVASAGSSLGTSLASVLSAITPILGALGAIILIVTAINFITKQIYERNEKYLKSESEKSKKIREELEDHKKQNSVIKDNYEIYKKYEDRIVLTNEELEEQNNAVDAIKEQYKDLVVVTDELGRKNIVNTQQLEEHTKNLDKQVKDEKELVALMKLKAVQPTFHSNKLYGTNSNEYMRDWTEEQLINAGYSQQEAQILDKYGELERTKGGNTITDQFVEELSKRGFKHNRQATDIMFGEIIDLFNSLAEDELKSFSEDITSSNILTKSILEDGTFDELKEEEKAMLEILQEWAYFKVEGKKILDNTTKEYADSIAKANLDIKDAVLSNDISNILNNMANYDQDFFKTKDKNNSQIKVEVEQEIEKINKALNEKVKENDKKPIHDFLLKLEDPTLSQSERDKIISDFETEYNYLDGALDNIINAHRNGTTQEQEQRNKLAEAFGINTAELDKYNFQEMNLMDRLFVNSNLEGEEKQKRFQKMISEPATKAYLNALKDFKTNVAEDPSIYKPIHDATIEMWEQALGISKEDATELFESTYGTFPEIALSTSKGSFNKAKDNLLMEPTQSLTDEEYTALEVSLGNSLKYYTEINEEGERYLTLAGRIAIFEKEREKYEKAIIGQMEDNLQKIEDIRKVEELSEKEKNKQINNYKKENELLEKQRQYLEEIKKYSSVANALSTNVSYADTYYDAIDAIKAAEEEAKKSNGRINRNTAETLKSINEEYALYLDLRETGEGAYYELTEDNAKKMRQIANSNYNKDLELERQKLDNRITILKGELEIFQKVADGKSDLSYQEYQDEVKNLNKILEGNVEEANQELITEQEKYNNSLTMASTYATQYQSIIGDSLDALGAKANDLHDALATVQSDDYNPYGDATVLTSNTRAIKPQKAERGLAEEEGIELVKKAAEEEEQRRKIVAKRKAAERAALEEQAKQEDAQIAALQKEKEQIEKQTLIESEKQTKAEQAAMQADAQVQVERINSEIAILEKTKEQLKPLAPDLEDLSKSGGKADDSMKKLEDTIKDLNDALKDLDDLLKDVNRDLNDIDVDYNPFTDLFEAWEAEWDYYYNIKNLLNQLETQSRYIDNIISSDYSTATDKLSAYDAKVGNITAKLAANDAYILTLRAGIAQKAKEFEEQFNEYYNVDHRMGGWQIFQRDTTLNQWEENINDVKRYSFELSKLINQQENELNVLEANQDALEQERSAYESMLSTVDSLIDSLKDNEDITVDLSGLEGAKVKLEAAIDDGSIEEVKEQIRNLNDYIQELNWQLDLNDNVVEKGLEDAYDDMEDGIDHIQELIDTLNDKLAEQQELLQNLTDIYNYYIDTAIDMQQELYNAIVEQYQDEINKKKEQYDYLKQLDKDYLQSVKDNINKERQAREDANKQKNYQQNLQRAQLLQMDTSGAYRNELASLNKELESQRQDLYDDLVDKQVEALEKEIEKRHELYDMEVNALQERLDYMQENAILLWEMVNDIVSNGADEMMATLENTTNYINQNELAREKQRKQWELNTQATYKGVVEGEIESLNQRIAKGKEYIDSLAEIREAIELSTNTYIASKDILEDEAGKMQMVMDNYMQVWTTMTSDLTGYHENWKTTVAAIQNAMENNIQALEDLGNEGGSIYLLNEKLKNIANEMYNSFIEERQAFKNAVDNTIESVRANITAMANGVINGVQQTANSLQANPNKDNGTSGAGNQYTPSSAANPAGSSGVQSVESEKAKKYKIEVNATGINLSTGKIYPIKSTLMGYQTSEAAVQAALNYIDRQLKNLGIILKSRGALTPIAYKQGGFADFTGPAWLDGTKSKPEAVLNAKQTRLFTSMVSSLERTAANNSNINSALGSSYNIGDINTSINVEKLDNETDIDKVAKQVENRIMKSIHNRVVLSVV